MAKLVKNTAEQSKVSDVKALISKKGSSGSWMRAIVGLILLIFSSALAVYGLISIPLKAKQISTLRSQILTNAMSSQDVALLKQVVEATKAEREALLAAFPNEASLLQFFTIIDQLKNDEVKVVQFSVDGDVPTKIGQSPSFLPMTLVLRGKPKAIQEALLSVARSPYFIRPITLNYSSDQTGEIVEVKTTFHLYVREPYAKAKS